jgi:hypothetical protein
MDRVDGFIYKSGSMASNMSLDKSIFDSWNSLCDQMAAGTPSRRGQSPAAYSFSSVKRSLESLGPASKQTSTHALSCCPTNLLSKDPY